MYVRALPLLVHVPEKSLTSQIPGVRMLYRYVMSSSQPVGRLIYSNSFFSFTKINPIRIESAEIDHCM
jgi:hypothetical protein